MTVHNSTTPDPVTLAGEPNDALRILQTCLSPSWGGLEMAALDLSLALQRHGHTLTIACLEGSRLLIEARSRGIGVIGLVPGKYLRLANVRRLSREMAVGRYDVIHAHVSGDLPTVVFAMLLARQSLPILLTKGIGSGIKKKDLFHRFLYSRVSRVLAVSRFVQRNVVETTPLPEERVMLLFNGLDTDRFSLRLAHRAEVRAEFAIPDDTVLVGFVGRFSPGKGHEEFLLAARGLSKRYTHLHFLVVGEASYGEEEYARTIKALCSSFELDDRVTFAGFRSDIPDVMAAFDIFAFPSHAESFGLSLVEAMAMERPVVSTRKDGTLDIVVDGETGYFVPSKDASSLAVALARLIDDPALRERMGKAGRRRVEDLFSQSGQIRALVQLYTHLCSPSSHHL